LIASNLETNKSYFTRDLVDRIKSMSLIMEKKRDQLTNINCLNSSLSFIHFSSAELVLLASSEINISEIKPKIMLLFNEIASEGLFF
jgi:predicted transcriptional regulator YheO